MHCPAVVILALQLHTFYIKMEKIPKTRKMRMIYSVSKHYTIFKTHFSFSSKMRTVRIAEYATASYR